jgi:molybdopterin converting factor small subunit
VIRVELYEMARRLAGVPFVDVEAQTLGEALAEAARRVPALRGEVIDGDRPGPRWRASVGGRRFVDDPATPLSDGDSIVLVSALAGG